MSIVKLLGFETLGCGCVVGHYRDAGTVRVVTYIEEKASTCDQPGHRRNHALVARRRRGTLASPSSRPGVVSRLEAAR